MKKGEISRKKNEDTSEYYGRINVKATEHITNGDYTSFYTFCNSTGYEPQGDLEIETYEKGRAEKIYHERNLERLTINEEKKGSDFSKIYHNYPSEVTNVPSRGRIRSELKNSLRSSGKKVPNDIDNWPINRCYAVYFKNLGIEKYDPIKHG